MTYKNNFEPNLRVEMKVPFNDLKLQNHSIRNEVNDAIDTVINNCSFALGPSVSEFEESFKNAHNVSHCLGTSSGTDANHMVLWALGIGPGDEGISPANTFIATAWGATLCGATPVFVDCDSESYNIDPKRIEEAITNKTKAVVAVHLYGQPADMDELLKITDKHGIYIVEDAAQAHLSEYKGKRVGGLSLAGSFSFYPGKNLGAFGEAGAVVTNDQEIADKIQMIRNQGQSKKYYHDSFGHNYRMEGIQGAVLNVKLKYLEKWTLQRREAAKRYKESLANISEIILPKELQYSKHVYHLFVIKTKKSGTETRDKLLNYLKENGIDAGLHYPVPIHLQKCFDFLGHKKGDFPNTEELAEQGLSLPLFPDITEEQIEYVSSSIKSFFSNNK